MDSDMQEGEMAARKVQGNYGETCRVWENHEEEAALESMELQDWSDTGTILAATVWDVGVQQHLTSKNCLRRMKEPICPELVMASILQGQKADTW